MELDERDDHHDQEEHHSLCLTNALPLGTGAAVEGIVDVQGQHFTGVGGFTGGQGHVLVKQLEAVGQGEEGADGHTGHDHGDLDLEQDLAVVGTVDLGRLDQVAGHALQAGHIDDHHVTDLLPAHQDHQAHKTSLGVQGQQRLLEVGQQAVQQDLPDVAQQDAADQVGHKVHGTEQVGALDAPGQHQRNGKGKHVDEHGAHHSKDRRKAKGMEEGGILEHGKVVLDAHKGGLGHGGESLEGQICAPDKGPDEADDKGDQSRQHKHRPVFTNGFLHDIPPDGAVRKKKGGGRTHRPPPTLVLMGALGQWLSRWPACIPWPSRPQMR